MKCSEQIDQIAMALATAQAGMAGVTKNRTVTVKTDTGSYTFDYATLDNIIAEVRAPLTANGLWFTQTLESGDEGKYRLVTTLVHKSGQWLASETPIVVQDGKNKNQMFGSALTYMRRYALAAMLGVASEDDDDANEADGNSIKDRQDRAPKSQAPIYNNGPKTAAPNGKNGKTTAADWADNAIEAINTAKDAKTLKEWKSKNRATIEKLAMYDATAANKINDLVDTRLDAMNVLQAG